ncbi:MAG: hypothetical protein IPK60_11445 [Sandaracinaceae bacterium]|nr:hypothetical protein [Sandaracinaceae bacterium]
MIENVESAARLVIDLLVGRRYRDLESLARGRRMTAAQIESAIAEYGRTLIVPPSDRLEFDAIFVSGTSPRQWSVNVTLWTLEEGRSDLTLTLTVEDQDSGLRVELDDIRVL